MSVNSRVFGDILSTTEMESLLDIMSISNSLISCPLPAVEIIINEIERGN